MVTRWWSYGSTPVFNQSTDIFNDMFLIRSSSEAASIQSCHCIFSDLHWQNSFPSGRSETGFFYFANFFRNNFYDINQKLFPSDWSIFNLGKAKNSVEPDVRKDKLSSAQHYLFLLGTSDTDKNIHWMASYK